MQQTTSTTSHRSHCSAYFCARAHRATMLSAVVKASATGTVELVQCVSIHQMPNQSSRSAASAGRIWARLKRVTGLSARCCVSACLNHFQDT